MNLVGEALRQGDVALDQRAVAIAAVGGQCRPDRQRPGPARHFGSQVEEVRMLGPGCRKIGRIHSENGIEQPAMPSMLRAFFAEAWMKPLAMTGTMGSPLIPRPAMLVPCSSPHHWRAAPRAVKFDMVAPVVSTPPQRCGRLKRSFSQAIATCSSLEPSGELTHNAALLSRADVSQSAARATGVEPPVTKWKNRGPAELTAACMPSVRRRVTVATLPFPS